MNNRYCINYNEEQSSHRLFINPDYNCIIFSNLQNVELIRIDLRTGILTVSDEMKNCQVEDISRQILEILDKSCIWVKKEHY